MLAARILAVSGLSAAIALAGSFAVMAEVKGQDYLNPLQAVWNSGPQPVLPTDVSALVPENHPDISATEARAINASIPFADVPFVTAAPFVFQGAEQDRARALTCLSAAMLYEAGQDPEGQRSVAQVVLNRVRHPAFPASVCEVVAQGITRQTGCQFTFTCDGSLVRRYSAAAIAAARARADRMLDGEVYKPVGLATHYHTDWVHPYWSDKLDKIARVGTHLFFKWTGYWGTRAGFSQKPTGQESYVQAFAHMETPGEGDPLAAAADLQAPGAPLPQLASATALTGMAPTPAVLTRAVIQRPIAAPAFNTSAAPDTETSNFVISPAALGGNHLRYAEAGKGVFYLELQPGTKSGQFRKIAERLCGTQQHCHVVGWDSGQQIPKGYPLSSTDKQNVRFEYQPYPASGRNDTCRNPQPGNATEGC